MDISLASGYVWSDGTYDVLDNRTWNIYKRTAIIAANSISMREGSTAIQVPFTANYSTIGIVSGDFDISVTCNYNRNDAGVYINRVNCVIDSNLTEYSSQVFASYNLTITDGNVIVYDSDSSTVTVMFKNGALGMNMSQSEPGRVMALVPRLAGRKLI